MKKMISSVLFIMMATASFAVNNEDVLSKNKHSEKEVEKKNEKQLAVTRCCTKTYTTGMNSSGFTVTGRGYECSTASTEQAAVAAACSAASCEAETNYFLLEKAVWFASHELNFK
jgi:hypothetical protein